MAGSGISPSVVEARGYRTLLGTEDDRRLLEEHGFGPRVRNRDDVYPALYIPIRNVRADIVGAQIKPAVPRVRTKTDGTPSPVKYETPSGRPPVLDVPAFTAEALNNEGTALWITEGMKKVDALVTQGMACIGLTGVFNWRSSMGVLGDWEDIPVKGRTVVLCFDADASGNRNVQLAMSRLGAWLRTRGAKEIKYIVVPALVGETAVKGVDDYLTAGGTIAGLAEAATSQAPGQGAADAAFTDAFLVEEAASEALDGKFTWASGLGWLVWTGRVWKEASDVEPVEAVRLWASARYDAALSEQRKDQSRNLTAQISGWRGVLSKGRIKGLVDLARGVACVQRDATEFDGDPDLLNAQNGTVHLPTGELRAHDPADHITKMCDAEYRPGFTHPTWDKALEAIPEDIREWKQDRLGQATSGYPVPDHQLIISHGSGSNGKSTVVATVRRAMGTYGIQVSDRLLMASPDAHPTELMDLMGARYAVLEETPEARHLNVQRVKATLGTPSIRARRIRMDPVEFLASHSLFINTNFKPIVTETDHGTWRRLCLMPWPYTYRKASEALEGPDDRRGDPDMEYAHLDPAVRSAALVWMVEGARRWYARGRRMLPNPERVVTVTRAWRAETDLVLGFIDDCVVFGPDEFTTGPQILAAFNAWLDERGHRPWTDKTFAGRFGAHDMVQSARVTQGRKRTGGRQQRGWFGVGLDNEGNSGGNGGSTTDPWGEPPVTPQPPADPEPEAPEDDTDPFVAPENNPGPESDDEYEPEDEFSGGRVGFDLETLDADKLFTAPRGSFVRLAGYAGLVGDMTDAMGRAFALGDIRRITRPDAGVVGHNIFFFDLPALHQHHGLRVEDTIPYARDLRIAAFQNDPPTSYETKAGGGFKSYSLHALAGRYLGDEKSDMGEALAKEYGGWDNIPVDDIRYAEYCRDDVRLAEELDKAIPYDPYEEREARVCAVTARATLEGFRVDVEGLRARSAELAERSAAGFRKLEEHGFPLTNKAGKPAKAPQRTREGKEAFGRALEASGFPADRWPRGADGTLSLGKDVMAFALGHAQRAVPAAVPLIEAVSEMNGIRNNAANVLKHVTPDGRVHPVFMPFQATGRWSVLDPGLTVLKKGVEDSERAFLIPEEGHVLVSIDLDQVDIRCVGAHSQDMNLIRILNDPERDIHTEIAERARVPRKAAKTLDLGWLYGRGIKGMVANTKGMTMETAMDVDRYMASEFRRVTEWQTEVRGLGEDGVLLDNGFGRRLRVDPERSYTQAPAMLGQSTTRDLIAEGLLDLAKRAPEMLPMLRVIVHDEVVASVPEKDAEECARVLQSCLSRMWAPAGASEPVRISAGQGKPFTFGRKWSDLYV
jgi:P4 family phage/plasmid primase-like protien